MSIDAKPDTDRGTPEPPPRSGPRHRRPRGRRPLSLLLAVAFFFAPAAAFVLGERPQEIENRRLEPLPSLADGWSFFPKFATWATDHLPLRKQAVEGNAALSERVFGEPPSYGSDTGGVAGVPGTAAGPEGSKDAPKVNYPVVVQGKNDWLYLGSDVSSTCEPSRTVADTLDRATRLATAVERSGRKFVLMVAPDKTTIWPRDLPDSYLGKGCSEARKAEFWTALRATPPPGTVDLRALLEAKQQADGAPIYRQTDTHWGEAGSVVYTRALADAVQPGLWPTVRVEPTGTVTRVGDLGRLIGRPRSDTYPGFRLVRPGVRFESAPEMPRDAPITLRNTSTNPASPLVSRPVLLLGDSYSNSARNIYPGLFSSLTLLHNEAALDKPDVAATAIAGSDVVVLEIVERSIAAGKTALLQDPALTAIEKALAASPR